MDVSSDPSDQHLLWNEYPDRICDSRSHFSNHFRDLPICVKGDHTDLKLTGKRRRRGSGFTIFRKITLPQMKWGLIYGIILCSARALGEFGAVNALSKTRGETFTLPLEIDALYMSGTTSSITAAFAVSSVLVLIAVVVLILRNIAWYRSQDKQQGKDGR